MSSITQKPRLVCGTLSYREESLERALEGISAGGFHAIELGSVCGYCEHVMPEELIPSQISALRKTIQSYNLQVRSIAGHIDLEFPLLGKGPDTAKEGYRRLRARVDLAADLGTDIVNTGIGVYDGNNPNELDRFYIEFGDLLDYAANKEVQIGLESHAGLTETAGATLELCQKLDRPNLGVNYDAANVRFYTGLNPLDDLKQHVTGLKDRLIHVHIKEHRGNKGDWDFPPLGEGDLDFPALKTLFNQIGYQGPYSLEIEFKGPDTNDPEATLIDKGIASSFAFMKNLGLEN